MNIMYPIRNSEPIFLVSIRPVYRNGKIIIVVNNSIIILSISL